MNNIETNNQLVSAEKSSLVINKDNLNSESIEIINKVIAETDSKKTKELVDLFNINQTKKTMARVNKLGELLDVITDQTIERYAARPDEVSNQELLQGLKIVQDIVERGQKQIAEGTNDTPLIQVNQQNNEINLGDGSNLNKESRDRVKNAVMSILAGIKNSQQTNDIVNTDVIEVQGEEIND